MSHEPASTHVTEPQASYPSPFYALFDGARDVTLSFPVDEKGIGPDWDDMGNVDSARGGHWETEDVAVVSLGGGRYRLAEKGAGPFSGLRLQWGDEFFAVDAGSLGGDAHPAGAGQVPSRSVTLPAAPEHAEGSASLRMLQVVMPRAFRHYGGLVQRPFSNDEPLARLVHRHGGGWENSAGGLLMISVPADATRRFEEEALRDLGIRLSEST